MKSTSLNCIFALTLFTCTGCVSTSISDSVALIEKESYAANNHSNKKNVNKALLSSIQALRVSQKVAKQHHTFTYSLHNEELNSSDKIKLATLLMQNSKHIIINIAPAKGNNKLHQLALSIDRAQALRLYINHFNKKVTIKFAPKLTNDTINLVTGA
ncbi:hypothetical protein [Colwellia psychrerythraea]|uniref:Uncharacterized protein n=1 Tax=Colwellia psychrerythraea TaxID=28229 RepID=A0A099K8A5_COLPS|nr:hypothetical protein [Colwellia psychrerythraea]KGJ86561.1 hypothetical protein GAB14E_0834 [Colwellia psychrerythraea]